MAARRGWSDGRAHRCAGRKGGTSPSAGAFGPLRPCIAAAGAAGGVVAVFGCVGCVVHCSSRTLYPLIGPGSPQSNPPIAVDTSGPARHKAGIATGPETALPARPSAKTSHVLRIGFGGLSRVV